MLEVSQQGGIRTLTLQRGERANALDEESVERLLEETSTSRLSDVAILVLRGNAKHFCAGFDLSDLNELTDSRAMQRVLRIALLLEHLYSAPCLTLAHAEGAAIGAGADLFAACDVRVAGPRASFRFPGSGFGLVLGTRRLASLVGGAVALQWTGTGRRIDRESAVTAGLVSSGETELEAELGKLATPTARALAAATRDVVPYLGLGEAAASVCEPGLVHRLIAFSKGATT